MEISEILTKIDSGQPYINMKADLRIQRTKPDTYRVSSPKGNFETKILTRSGVSSRLRRVVASVVVADSSDLDGGSGRSWDRQATKHDNTPLMHQKDLSDPRQKRVEKVSPVVGPNRRPIGDNQRTTDEQTLDSQRTEITNRPQRRSGALTNRSSLNTSMPVQKKGGSDPDRPVRKGMNYVGRKRSEERVGDTYRGSKPAGTGDQQEHHYVGPKVDQTPARQGHKLSPRTVSNLEIIAGLTMTDHVQQRQKPSWESDKRQCDKYPQPDSMTNKPDEQQTTPIKPLRTIKRYRGQLLRDQDHD